MELSNFKTEDLPFVVFLELEGIRPVRRRVVDRKKGQVEFTFESVPASLFTAWASSGGESKIVKETIKTYRHARREAWQLAEHEELQVE